MTVRDLINRLTALIATNAAVADLEVDSEGCDCIEPALDIRIERGRVLVAREAPVAPIVRPLSKEAMAFAERLLRDGRIASPDNRSQSDAFVELCTRGFIRYEWSPINERFIVLSDAGREFLRAYHE